MLQKFVYNAKENAKVVVEAIKADPKGTLVFVAKVTAASAVMSVAGIILISALANNAEQSNTTLE